MSKRKSNTEITVTANKKLLKDITGVDKDLGLKTTADTASQTEKVMMVIKLTVLEKLLNSLLKNCLSK